MKDEGETSLVNCATCGQAVHLFEICPRCKINTPKTATELMTAARDLSDRLNWGANTVDALNRIAAALEKLPTAIAAALMAARESKHDGV